MSVGRTGMAVIALAGVASLSAMAFQPERPPADRAPGERPPGQPERGPGRGQFQAPSVEGSMRAMNRAARTLREQVGDPSKRDENLTLITEMQRGCVNAKGASMAEFLKDLPDDDRTAKADEFRGEMIELARLMLDMEEATLKGDAGEASAIFARIVELRDHEHEEFGVDEDDEAEEGAEEPPRRPQPSAPR